MARHGKAAHIGEPIPVSSKLQLFFHLSSFTLFSAVFSWHFGSAAKELPGGKGFGWFYKNLTFCGFNLQLVTLFLCVLTHVVPKNKRLRQVADDLACTTFGIANVITIMYWSILFITMKPVEPDTEGVGRTIKHGLNAGAPLWINLTVHLVNSIIAWTDIIINDRMFRARAFVLSLFFGLGYFAWVQYATSINKVYPYPFLNSMPQPQGFICISVVGNIIFYAIFRLGNTVARRHGPNSVYKVKTV